MTELEYRFTNDTLFKMLFVKYPILLKRLVAQLLRIPFEKAYTAFRYATRKCRRKLGVKSSAAWI